MLSRLMCPLFEPLATCCLLHLSMKVAFLVSITSARRVGGLCVLMSGAPYTIFFKGRVYLHHLWGLSQRWCPCSLWTSQFTYYCSAKSHIWTRKRNICTPYTSEEHWCSTLIDLSSQLFVEIVDKMKNQPISTQRISSRIASCNNVLWSG